MPLLLYNLMLCRHSFPFPFINTFVLKCGANGYTGTAYFGIPL